MLGEFLNWGWTTKYTRSLEIEVARLRAENLALLNSILGVAGVPPLRVDHAGIDSVVRNRDHGEGRTRGAVAPESQAAPPRKSVGTPVRRRSWPQIGRAFEADDASRQQRVTVHTGIEERG